MAETPWGRRIREEMNRRGWDNAQLARMSGLSESTVSRVLSGSTRSPGIDAVRGVALAFGISIDELAGTAQRSNGPRSVDIGPVALVPLVDVVLAAGEPNFIEAGESIPMPMELAQGSRLIASRVSGDCMEPEIMSGDIVIVDLAAREPRPGQIVAALLRDGTMAVKRYERHRGYPRLVDNKGRVYPVDGAQIQGLVVSFIRRFR